MLSNKLEKACKQPFTLPRISTQKTNHRQRRRSNVSKSSSHSWITMDFKLPRQSTKCHKCLKVIQILFKLILLKEIIPLSLMVWKKSEISSFSSIAREATFATSLETTLRSKTTKVSNSKECWEMISLYWDLSWHN